MGRSVLRHALVAIAVFVGVWVLLLVCGRFSRTMMYIDARSGARREETYVFSLKVRDTETETRMSRMYAEIIGEPGQPAWRLEHIRLWPWGSATCTYVGASEEADWLAQALAHPRVTGEARRAALLTFLRLLENGSGAEEATDYASRVKRLVWDRPADAQGDIVAEDLPDGPE